MIQTSENSLNVYANGLTSEEAEKIRNCIREIARRRKAEGKEELNWELELNSRRYVPRKKRDTEKAIYLTGTMLLRK